jgi:Protein-disulfide isomerase
MTKVHTCLALFLALISVPGQTQDDLAADKENISRSLQMILPDETITGIKTLPIGNLYEVVLGPNVIYMSGDGRYVFRGDLLDMQDRQNLSEQVRAAARKEVFAALTQEAYIEFSPDRPENIIYVFTDVDCSYCRRLHRDVPVLNQNGLGIRYLAYPRGGIGSRTFRMMEAIWCADDRRQALTDAKNGKQVSSKKCQSPVAYEYELGQKMGVRGTPGIYTEDGEELAGYVPPEELLILIRK